VSRKKDYGLISGDGSIRVELHWRLSGPHFDLPVNLKYLWDRLETVDLAGQPVRSLPLNDLLLYLTMHGSRHGWARLIFICDIAEIVRLHDKDIDWDKLMLEAGQLGSKRNLLLGLFLAHHLLDAKLPGGIHREFESEPMVKKLAGEVRNFLFNASNTQDDIAYWQAYHLNLKERFRERARLRFHYWYRYLRIALTPNTRDRAMVSLPRYLSFAYYFLRVSRLVNRLFRPGRARR
jgi:hypothetical protein